MYKQYSPKIPNHSLSVTNLGKSRLVYYFQDGSFPWLKVFFCAMNLLITNKSVRTTEHISRRAADFSSTFEGFSRRRLMFYVRSGFGDKIEPIS